MNTVQGIGAIVVLLIVWYACSRPCAAKRHPSTQPNMSGSGDDAPILPQITADNAITSEHMCGGSDAMCPCSGNETK